MTQFIKVCESRYGNRTCIYHYVNPEQIVEVHIEKTQHEKNIVAILTADNQRVIIINKRDLINLVGLEQYHEIEEELNDE